MSAFLDNPNLKSLEIPFCLAEKVKHSGIKCFFWLF